jgi:serine/threonine protein kinase
MVDFIKQCLQIDPTQRLQAEEALRHDWFKDLLIDLEKKIDQTITTKNQIRAQKEMDEESESSREGIR